MPRPDRKFSAMHGKVFEKLPVTQLAERYTWASAVESLSVAWIYSRALARTLRGASRLHMKLQTKSKPGLFEKVWPDYPLGCKRILFSNNSLPPLARENVQDRQNVVEGKSG